MKPGLLLLDLQHEFLHREGLAPEADVLEDRVGELLDLFRERNLPVLHAQTITTPDGDDRMPHWRRRDLRACVEGSPGARPPARLAPREGERRFRKRFYDAFEDPELEPHLRDLDVETLVIAGVYLHACVASTVLAAYQRGFEVWVAADAVATTEPEHAELERVHLEARAARFLGTGAIAEALEGKPPSRVFVRRRPSHWDEVLAEVPLASVGDVDRATRAAAESQARWAAFPGRADVLDAWAARVEAGRDELARLVATEMGKPVRDGRAEMTFAAGLIRASARSADARDEHQDGELVCVRRRPHGVVGLVTPWNNPVGIPAGKIAATLAAGNGAVWKPALEVPRTSERLLEMLRGAGAPAGLVTACLGDGTTARAVVDDARVRALSFTGSTAVGRALAARAARHGKPFQGELGGNNAALVFPDVDVRALAPALARAAFANAGQRCTAIRRVLVHRSVAGALERALATAFSSWVLGDPHDEQTDVGPLVSRPHRDRVRQRVAAAVADGARLVTGGTVPTSLADGCWLSPALLADVPRDLPIVRTETFGPVALLQTFEEVEEAIALANDVEHGLVAAVLTKAEDLRRFVGERVEAGVLTHDPGLVAVHPDAPFTGWKRSGIGLPEHGAWDIEFHTRPQAVYGKGAR